MKVSDIILTKIKEVKNYTVELIKWITYFSTILIKVFLDKITSSLSNENPLTIFGYAELYIFAILRLLELG